MLRKILTQSKLIPKFTGPIKNYLDYTEKRKKVTYTVNIVRRVLINTTVKGKFVNEAVKSEF